MRKLIFLVLSLAFAGLLSCRHGEEKETLTIFAAASTSDLISDIAALYEKEKGIRIKINGASSGVLAKQIQMGAEADIYISASSLWTGYLETLELTLLNKPFLQNRLVLISSIDSQLEPFSLNRETNLPQLFTSRLSLGDPDHVPAGQYAEEALTSLGWYSDLTDRMLPASDVRAALSVVEFDETELGIVYETDALKSRKVKIISFFPEDSYSPVLYFCSLLKNSKPSGRIFFNYLVTSEEVKRIYSKYGFSNPEKGEVQL